MKNTKKIALSLIASALLTTTAFAVQEGNGKLFLTAGSGAATNEYVEKYGAGQTLNVGDMNYTAQILGSGSVSDALIRLDMTDTNLSASLSTVADSGFVQGLTGLQDENNVTIATFDKRIVVAGSTYYLFDGDATEAITDGISYEFNDIDTNLSSNITYKFVAPGDTVALDVYSTSGTEDLRDETNTTVQVSETPQFLVNCVAKFDGLISFEDTSYSFIGTSHDTNATDGVDHRSLKDGIVFTVDNAEGNGLSLDGNSSVLSFYTVDPKDGTTPNSDNNFSDPAKWTVQLTEVESDGASTTTLITDTLANSALANATELDYNVTNGNVLISFRDDDILPGKTTYYVDFIASGTTSIQPVKFVNSKFLIEAGETDGNNSILPARNTGTASTELGLWQDHAYIAQIAGASSKTTKMETKLFIVNRSCQTVKPIFKIIKDTNGIKETAMDSTYVASIEPDTQGFYKMKDILVGLGLDATGSDYGKYAIEVTLPGIAEDFYIYAQVTNLLAGTPKDLPVYNTSDRN